MPQLKRAPHPQPLVLVAASDQRQLQDLSRVVSSGPFRVTGARDERELMAAMHVDPPDGVVLACDVAQPGHALCSTLRTLAVATPVILILPTGVTRASEHDALRAGAWAALGTPTDPDALLLRLTIYVEPKRELDRVSEECLVDRISGLYNHSGLTRRATELAALVTRHGWALTCAVFRPDAPLPNHSAGDRFALAFKSVGRASDALGRTGRAEFTVFAPAKNGTAGRLVRRMTDNVERAFGSLREQQQRVGVRSGYSTALAAHRISPPMLLARARHALEMNR
jgi:PleD family two-component response regulator